MRSKADETLVIIETLICPLNEINFLRASFNDANFCKNCGGYKAVLATRVSVSTRYIK